MDRRLGGVLLLIAAALTAVISSHVSAAEIVGRAAAVPLAQPAAVGDCVYNRQQDTVLTQDAVMTPAPQIIDCARPHFGEVYAVVEDSALTPSAALDHCLSEFDSAGYLGVTYAGTDGWVPAWNSTLSLVLPGAREHDAGQRWAACAIFVPGGNSALVGSIRSAYTEGRVPPGMGFCTESDASAYFSVPCIESHSSELFGFYYFQDLQATQAQIRDRCRDFIAAQTEIPDPTSVDGLTVIAQVLLFDDSDVYREAGGPVEPGDHGQIVCQLRTTGGRQLSESLLSLGSAPIPWA